MVCQLWLAIFKVLLKVAKLSKACQEKWKVYHLITVFKDLCLFYLKRLVIFCLHSSLSILVFLLPMLCQLFHFAGSFVSKVYSTVHSGLLWQKFGDKSNILPFISGKNRLNMTIFKIKKWNKIWRKVKRTSKNIFKKR